MLNNGELLFHKDFHDTIRAFKEANLNNFDDISKQIDINHELLRFNKHKIESINKDIYVSSHQNGGDYISKIFNMIGAYDESFFQYDSLEGNLFLTSHSFVILTEYDWVPINLLTTYFVTSSFTISEKNNLLEYSKEPSVLLSKKYSADRKIFLTDNVQKGCILFIDGPLIGGNQTYYTIDMVKELNDMDITPIFFVKNSASSLLINSNEQFKKDYNSDIHWASVTLKSGEFSNWFKYTDQLNQEFCKIFCYYKPYTGFSPQRIELHPHTFIKNENRIDQLLDCISYLMVANGDKRNPQIRPIAIAEKYARETKKYVNVNKLIKSSGLVPTMNEERGFN